MKPNVVDIMTLPGKRDFEPDFPGLIGIVNSRGVVLHRVIAATYHEERDETRCEIRRATWWERVRHRLGLWLFGRRVR